MTKLNKEIAINKLVNLSSALNACGIETEFREDADHKAISLYAHLWNCNDGSIVRLEVWAEDRTDYEIESCANPLSSSNLAEMIENL